MITELFFVLPMAIIAIGALILMLLSHSERFDLNRLNLIAVFFLAISFAIQYSTMGEYQSTFLYPGIF
ncbi:MAG: hypothetical protein HKP62_07460, partial [Sulfurovum sp.]|nr:hypothetical protein [Sulfurovum sp.]NNJ45837.1 hypothetical protein [Sulfurovum sp.]